MNEYICGEFSWNIEVKNKSTFCSLNTIRRAQNLVAGWFTFPTCILIHLTMNIYNLSEPRDTFAEFKKPTKQKLFYVHNHRFRVIPSQMAGILTHCKADC